MASFRSLCGIEVGRMSSPVWDSEKDVKFTACHGCDTEFLVPWEDAKQQNTPSMRNKPGIYI